MGPLAASLARKGRESEAVMAAALDLIREQELRKVLLCLDENGIQPLLLKGVALGIHRLPVSCASTQRRYGFIDSRRRFEAGLHVYLETLGTMAQMSKLISSQSMRVITKSRLTQRII